MSTLYSQPERHEYLDRPIDDLHHRRIVAGLLDLLGIRAGDCVVEVGAGSGRYTALLLQFGLRVVAIEPDAVLSGKLQRRLDDEPRARVVPGYAYSSACYPADTAAVCGFHVLHHMDSPALGQLRGVLRDLASTRSGLRGWFFLEPNPFNPLYLAQIVLHPSMRLKEEAGIWRNRYDESLGDGKSVAMGYVGWLPPGIARVAPQWLQRRGTSLQRRKSALRAYQALGLRLERDLNVGSDESADLSR